MPDKLPWSEQVEKQSYGNGTMGDGVWSGKSKRGDGKMKSNGAHPDYWSREWIAKRKLTQNWV